MRSHTHQDGGPVCRFGTIKECDERFAEAQADSQVALAQHIVDKGRAKAFKSNGTVFDQLVLIVAGALSDFTTANGVPSDAPFTKRLRAALARHANPVRV